MLSDHFYDYVPLSGLQKVTGRFSLLKALAVLLVVGFLAVALDYVRMLWLRRKMVSELYLQRKEI